MASAGHSIRELVTPASRPILQLPRHDTNSKTIKRLDWTVLYVTHAQLFSLPVYDAGQEVVYNHTWSRGWQRKDQNMKNGKQNWEQSIQYKNISNRKKRKKVLQNIFQLKFKDRIKISDQYSDSTELCSQPIMRGI